MQLQKHILNVGFPNIWAIHIELMAAATLFQVLLHCSKPCASSSTYIQKVFKTLNSHIGHFDAVKEMSVTPRILNGASGGENDLMYNFYERFIKNWPTDKLVFLEEKRLFHGVEQNGRLLEEFGS